MRPPVDPLTPIDDEPSPEELAAIAARIAAERESVIARDSRIRKPVRRAYARAEKIEPSTTADDPRRPIADRHACKETLMGGLNGQAKAIDSTAVTSAEEVNCPKCGWPYGKRRRCHYCFPGGRPVGRTPELSRPDVAPSVARTPATPPLPASPLSSSSSSSSLIRELEAVRQIAAALEGLSTESTARVLAFLRPHFDQT